MMHKGQQCRLTAICLVVAILGYRCNNSPRNPETAESFVTPGETTKVVSGVSQGYKYNRNWRMSVAGGAGFVDLHTDTSGRTYAITDYGVIYSRHGNENWKRETVDTGYVRFTAIDGYDGDVFAVGHRGVVFHKKGNGNWMCEMPAGDSLWFTAVQVWKNEVWAVAGLTGSVWHRNAAGKWTQQFDADGPIFQLQGYGAELWALGRKNLYHKKPDTSWITYEVAADEVDFFTFCRYGKQLWAMGSKGNVFFNNGDGRWKKDTGIHVQDDITCSYARRDEIFAAGKNGLLLHRATGDKWKQETTGYHDFSAACMYGRGADIWIGGSDGLIFRKTGSGPWIREAGPNRARLIHGIDGYGDMVFAAGNYATLLTKSPDYNWARADSLMPDTPLTAIFRFDNDILVAGNDGILYHRTADGQWKLENSGAGNVVFSDLYENDQSVYLIGSKGAIAWRRKSDSLWKSVVTGAANLTRIYGHKSDIWIVGNHSTILHKKENDSVWKPVSVSISEVDFVDLYGWKDQLWALGAKDGRGIIFYKDSNNAWSREDIHNGTDHYHALYGRNDTVWAAGASGEWGSKDRTKESYEGTIMCKEGKNDWKKELYHVRGVHFNDINGIGNHVYAIGFGGRLFHKNGVHDWQEIKTGHADENLQELHFYKGLLIRTENGFLYRENEEKNFISIGRTNQVGKMVLLDDHVYCIGRNAIFRISPGEEKYPVVDRVRYAPSPLIDPTSIDLSFVLQRPAKVKSFDLYDIDIYARPYVDNSDNFDWVPVARDIELTANDRTDAFKLSTNIEVAKSLRVIPGLKNANKIALRVDVATTDGVAREKFVLKDVDGNPYFLLNNDFWIVNRIWLIPAGLMFGYYTFWLILCFCFPLVFLRIYHADILQRTLAATRYQWMAAMMQIVLPLKKLAETARVQNAWIRAFAANADRKFGKSEMVQLRSSYVPLPVRIDDPVAGVLVEKPHEVIANEFFSKQRTIVQIIGPGGSGKTSLAVALGKRIIAEARSARGGRIARLPIVLETDSTDILKDITRMLRSWQNDYAISEEFVRMLLKSQRLVVIADSLSEKPAAIQEYFRTLHGDTPVNALIITARQPVDLQVKEGVHLFPLPLNSNNLLHFITTYLSKNDTRFGSREQLAFAERIVSIIEGTHNKALVTPILVRLIIGIALRKEDGDKKDFQTILHEMPDSIPDVYYQYLVQVNPKQATAPNYLPKQLMLQLAELLAQLALGDRFVPQHFTETSARKAISEAFGNIAGDPIQRLVDNEILTRRESLSTSYLRFNMDPLAEYLAASKLYDQHCLEGGQLSSLVDKVDALGNEAAEFKMAFHQILGYRMKHG